MGQRLVMSIYENSGEEPIVNVYYHWSAYSRSAYYKAARFIEALYYNIERSDSIASDVIQALESCGARVLEEDRKNVIKELNYEPLTDNLNRNEGLIAYSEDQREDNLRYAEGELDIILSSEEVFNYCFWVGDEDEDDEDDDENEIPQIDNLEYATFDTLNQIMNTLVNMVNDGIFRYRNECGDIIHLIE